MRLRPDHSDSEHVPSTPDPSKAPTEVRKLFWAIVILLNLGFLAVSLGLMIAGFWGRYRDGAILVAGGLVVLFSAYRRYQGRHAVFDDAE